MAEEPEEKPEALANPEKRSPRSYTDEERFIALAAVDLNGGNVHRTAVALEIPARTLADWVESRTQRIAQHQEHFAEGRKEKRGSLAAKLEDKIHTVVESITPEVIRKATLSQRGVFLGIGIDKLRMLLGQGLEPDPATELCRLLNINRAQLPPSLQLEPGEEIPEGFGPVVETTETTPGSFEPAPDKPSDDQALMDEPDDDKPPN